MKYSANKNLLILAVTMGGISSIVFVWADHSTETLAETLKLPANAVGAWLMISAPSEVPTQPLSYYLSLPS